METNYIEKFKYLTNYNPKDGGQFNSLNESSINRIVHWLNTHSVAMLTSDRNRLTNIHIHSGDKPNENIYTRTLVDIPLNSKYTSNQKLNRRNILNAYLLKKGYGVTEVIGSYIEGLGGELTQKENVEKSFFVVNLDDNQNFKSDIFRIGEWFNQDSILYKPRDSENAYLIGTNDSSFPSYGKEEMVGVFKPKVVAKFMTRIKNAGFIFGNDDTETISQDNNSFYERKTSRKIEYVVNLTLSLYNEKKVSGQSLTDFYNSLSDKDKIDIWKEDLTYIRKYEQRLINKLNKFEIDNNTKMSSIVETFNRMQNNTKYLIDKAANQVPFSEKKLLDESGYARVANIMRGIVPSINTFAILTAENQHGVSHDKNYNIDANKKLQQDLLNAHYGLQKVKGSYGNLENSFFIPNITKEDAMSFASKYEQESIIFGEKVEENKNGQHYIGMAIKMIGTDKTNFGDVLGEKLVFINDNNRNDYYSVVKGRKFYIPFLDEQEDTISTSYKDAYWKGGTIQGITKTDLSQQGVKESDINEIDKLLKESLRDGTTFKHKWQYRGLLRNKLNEINNLFKQNVKKPR
jgi:hypothetical protein